MIKANLSMIYLVALVFVFIGCATTQTREVAYLPVPVSVGSGETVKVYNGRGENIPVWMLGSAPTFATTSTEETTEVKVTEVEPVSTVTTVTTAATPLQFYFDEGVAALNDEQRSELDALGKTLRVNPESIAIEGYTDPKGQRSANYTLGLLRANAVKNYLESQGVPTTRIRVTSFGESRDPERKVILRTQVAE